MIEFELRYYCLNFEEPYLSSESLFRWITSLSKITLPPSPIIQGLVTSLRRQKPRNNIGSDQKLKIINRGPDYSGIQEE